MTTPAEGPATVTLTTLARIICEAHQGDGCKPWDDETFEWRETYRDMAAAVLASDALDNLVAARVGALTADLAAARAHLEAVVEIMDEPEPIAQHIRAALALLPAAPTGEDG